MTYRVALLALVLLLTISKTANTQQSETHSTETGLAIEVRTLRKASPSYQPVHSNYRPTGGTWYTQFDRIDSGKPETAESLIRVRIVPYLDGDQVKVVVSVIRGRFHEAEDIVGRHSVREGERFETDELKLFGIVPFTISVIRVSILASDAPLIENHTSSLRVVRVEPLISTFPKYRITAYNSATKKILALKLEIWAGGKLQSSGLPHEREGEALFQPSSYGELLVPVPVRAKEGTSGYTPIPISNPAIVFGGLVFDDGSYEGDIQLAATFGSFTLGRTIELRRITSLLDKTLAPGTEVPSPSDFRSQLSGLSYQVPPGT
jgi:hypothetical protein